MIKVRPSAAASVLVLAIAAAASCNSSQPTQNETQRVSLSFAARSINPLWDCWDTTPPVPPKGVYCEQVLVAGVPQQVSGLNPWAMSSEVSIIPAGKTVEEVIASTVGEPGVYAGFTNVTQPDPATYSGLVIPSNPTAGITYSNPRRVGQTSPSYIAFRNLAVPAPNVFGSPNAFEFTVHKGDTIIVRARKIPVQNYVLGLVAPFPGDNVLELKISGALTINGAEANALGTTQSQNADASGMTFSYTVR